MIKIVVEDYVQHLSSYNYHLTFKPQLLFGEPFQYQNRIAIEFNHLYHWHPLMPDDFNINGTKYNLKEFVFHPEILVKHGIREFVDSLSKQRAGAVSSKSSLLWRNQYSAEGMWCQQTQSVTDREMTDIVIPMWRFLCMHY